MHALEGFDEAGQAGLALVGQQQLAIGAAEEGAAEMILELLDLLAHGTRRHRELVGGLGQAQVPRRGHEGAQRVQGRQAFRGNCHSGTEEQA